MQLESQMKFFSPSKMKKLGTCLKKQTTKKRSSSQVDVSSLDILQLTFDFSDFFWGKLTTKTTKIRLMF